MSKIPFLLAAAFACPTLVMAQDNSDQIRATVAEMLADAETRTSLLSAGDAGHDGGFFLAGDGFKLSIGGNVQFRYMANFRDDRAGQDDFESGFQSRYTQLFFSGNINKDWIYRIQANFDKDGGGMTLEDAYFGYVFPSGWIFLGGQVKAPLLRETLLDNWKQQAVETSVAESFFGGGRTQAIALAKIADDWAFWCAFSDGAHADNTDFTSFNGVSEADYSITPRFQYKFAGDWKQFEDFTSPRGSNYACMIGAAGHWQQSRNTNNPADADVTVIRYTLDASVEGDGWNLFGAFMGQNVDVETLGTDSDALDDFGAVVQGGFYVSDKAEIFARWDAIFADSDRNFSEDNFHFLTAGVNYYFAGHAAKFTLDGVYALQDDSGLISASTLPNTNVGLLGDTEDGEFVLRAQFQIMF